MFGIAYRPRFMLRGDPSKLTCWSGIHRIADVEVPPTLNNALAGPRIAASAACTRMVATIFRIRNRLGEYRFALMLFGHQPVDASVSCASVSFTSAFEFPPFGSAA